MPERIIHDNHVFLAPSGVSVCAVIITQIFDHPAENSSKINKITVTITQESRPQGMSFRNCIRTIVGHNKNDFSVPQKVSDGEDILKILFGGGEENSYCRVEK